MAILLDPLFSEEARGTIGSTITFRRSAVHPIAGAYASHPINWTAPKITQALAWQKLCNQWRSLPESLQSTWRDLAPGVLTGFNYFMQCKGVFPLGPCYVVPAGDSLYFNFIDASYSPPSGSFLNFNWDPCI